MRACRFVLVLVLVLAPGRAAWAGDAVAKLVPARVARPPLFSYALPEGTKGAPGVDCRSATLGTRAVLLFDLDGNGRFDDLGVDGWTLPEERYIVPLEDVIVVGPDEVRIGAPDDDRAKLRHSAQPIRGDRHQLDALARLNALRLRNGLPPAGIDAGLSAACKEHCAYMVKHGQTHFQVPGRPGYTEGGAAAGRRSCLSQQETLASAAQTFYDTFYHRLPLMSPDTRAFGLASVIGFNAIDGRGNRKERPWRWPIVIPAPDTEGHPTTFPFEGEIPKPYSGPIAPGCPITVELESAEIAGVTAELIEQRPKAPAIELLVSWPGKPANPQRPENSNAICLIPRKPLRLKTEYLARVRYTYRGEAAALEWRFKTGL